ncbi:MAG: ABC transporter substrate-binding protein [Streptomyces sp.]|jgi:iron complex transport system substrate-binding protein|nr:ABC transporter substrate-binding protein [Streptomyces sp.]
MDRRRIAHVAAGLAVVCLLILQTACQSAGGSTGAAGAASPPNSAAATPFASDGATAIAGIVTSDAISATVTKRDQAQCGHSVRHLTDATGTVVTLSSEPKRVVVVQPSFADEFGLIGIRPIGIGDDNDPNLIIPEITAHLGTYTSIGLRQTPSVAIIDSLHPDLIVSDVVDNVAIETQLRNIAPTLALFSDHTDYQQNLDSAQIIAAAVNKCPSMQKVLAQHARAMAAIRAEIPKKDHKRTFVVALSNKKNVSIFNYQQYATSVISSLGLKAAATGPEFQSGDAHGTSMETLATLNPEIIFNANENNAPSSLLDTWKATQLWQAMAAPKSHNVYLVDQHAWSLMRGITASQVIGQQAVQFLKQGQ